MENATKALLISGAVLVSLVLIGIGINIVSTASRHAGMATDAGSEMSDTLSQQTDSFHHKFSGLGEIEEVETEILETENVQNEDGGPVTKPGDIVELPSDPIIGGSSIN